MDDTRFNDLNNFKDVIKQKTNLNMKIPFKTILYIALGILVLVLIFSNVYMLGSNQQAVITRFGHYVRTENEAGLKVKIPFIEKKMVVDVEGIRRMEFGYRSNKAEENEAVNLEARMLTGDQNLVIADWAIMYRISDSYKYIFNVEDQEGTFRTIAESSYRRIVASHPLDDILTNQKETIQFEVKELLQQICNKYNFGITITTVQLQDALPPDPVKAAFLEVASAKEDKDAKINEAKKYENEKLPVARGQAQQIINQATGYKQQRINEATGAASKFNAIQKEYSLNPAIMKTRLYLEAIKSVLPGVKEVYIMNDSGEVLKFLPINSDTSATQKTN